MQRWWQYQKERFPLLPNGLLIFVFSFSALNYSALLRKQTALPSLATIVLSFVVCLLFFLQLRIADEFKDVHEDSRYRPYRPVPRGLVSLKELGVLALISMLLQLLLVLWLEPGLVLFLLLVWLYWGLMWREFFVPVWLKARPLLYLVSHMLILPLIQLFATACDWRVTGDGRPKPELLGFLVLGFLNGMVMEIGRKLRLAADEEPGVETYSSLYGIKAASFLWLTALLLSSLAGLLAASAIALSAVLLLLLSLLLGIALVLIWRFQQNKANSGKNLELFSAFWTLALYFTLGIVPFIWRP